MAKPDPKGQPRYASSGHLVYAQGGDLMAVPFDVRRLEVTGVAVPVVEGVFQSQVSGAAQYDLSATGSLVYVSGGFMQPNTDWCGSVAPAKSSPLAAPAHAYVAPRLSPDGRQVAVGIAEGDTQVWLYDLTRETLTRFTFDGDVKVSPAWTPDGKRIAFYLNQGRAAKHLLATGRWQWRTGEVDHQRTRTRFRCPRPGWKTAGLP